MVSKYFEIKTKEKEFNEYITNLITELKDKKVIIFGYSEDFVQLNKIYGITEKLNIVAVSDTNVKSAKKSKLKFVEPKKIIEEDFDTILVTNGNFNQIKKYLLSEPGFEGIDIRPIFNEIIKDEYENLNYLYKFHFDKTLPKLVKKLKNKSVMLYGAGVYLELIKKYFDLTGLNIVGIADKRYQNHDDNQEFFNYKVFSPDEIKKANPDCVVVATKCYVNIIEDLYYNTLKETKIKIKPLVKIDFFSLLKEL